MIYTFLLVHSERTTLPAILVRVEARTQTRAKVQAEADYPDYRVAHLVKTED